RRGAPPEARQLRRMRAPSPVSPRASWRRRTRLRRLRAWPAWPRPDLAECHRGARAFADGRVGGRAERSARPHGRRTEDRAGGVSHSTHRPSATRHEVPARGASSVGDRRPRMNMDVIVSLSKRRGFIFQLSEIYGGKGELTAPRQFNLMFKTFMGPVEEDASLTYLRPETAQGIFVNFDNVLQATRRKLPFGVAQIGKAFRNEITPGNFIFRSREFEQMEMQYFATAAEAPRLYDEWKRIRRTWHVENGIPLEKLRFRDHAPDERAHYAAAATDIEFEFPFGWKEFEGIHYRTDYDLRRH